ncbi:multiprotein-bridging factor 1 family protein [Kitasatospora sp. NPDC052896]|uniref:multiprotein-bridging factor 1 family protein n=1 Tax=Kitasatospora sp. NPDC052896 TaxID=3364061 RepID=UPI0037C711F9
MIARMRKRRGWFQRDLAAEVERTEDWVSAVERDIIPVRDVAMLRKLSQVLGVSMDELLSHMQPTSRVSSSPRLKSRTARLTTNLASEDGDDPVRRRELLAAAAAAVFVTPLGAGTASAQVSSNPVAPLEDWLLYGTVRVPASREPSEQTIAAAVRASRQEFRSARYDALAQALPGRLAAAQSFGTAEQAATAVADLYNIAVRLCIKTGDDNLVAITSDRALTSARTGGNALTIAEAQRMVSSAWRRQGQLARATDIAVRAAHDLADDRGTPQGTSLAAQADLYATAAYTAAKMGDRQTSHALISEAAASSKAAGGASGPVDGLYGVALHHLSVHYELGDAGQAIALARTIDPTSLPTPERQARFFIDVARCFEQWNKPEQCYRSLLAAEQAAPQEIRRGSVRNMAAGLLRHDRALPGVRDFAARAGVQLV